MSEPWVPPGGTTPFLVLLDEAMRWTRRHFRAIYPAIAVPIALASAGTAAVQASLQPGGAMLANPAAMLARAGALLLLLVPLLGVIFLADSAVQVGTVDAVAGRQPDMGRAWRFVVRPRVLATQVLHVIALFAAASCCLVPLLYVMPLLSFVTAAMVEEQRFLGEALSRSAELARYNPERRFLTSPIVQILAVLLVSFILQYVVGLIVALPVTAGQMVSMFRRAAAGETLPRMSAGWMWAQVGVQLVTSLLSTVVTLYRSFVISLLFFEVRRRREGSDLRRAIDALAPPDLPPGSSAAIPPPPLQG